MVTSNDIAGNVCIIVASNDRPCLERNLLASDLIKTAGVTVEVIEGAASAAEAYNQGLDRTTAEYVIFAHQDVYFPVGWMAQFVQQVQQLSDFDPTWAVAAPFGVSLENKHVGDVWTTSLSKRLEMMPAGPVAAQTFDELVIILRRSSGLRFDEQLPLFHLYGTDIVQMARAAGQGAYVVHLPVVHNDGFKDRLRADFRAGYDFIRRKWRAQLPLRTPVVFVTATGFALTRYKFRAWRSFSARKSMAGDDLVDPKHYARACGLE